MKSLLIVFALGAGLLSLAACGDSGEGGDLKATLTEFSIVTEPESLPEGPIGFEIQNDGEREHEFLIIRTDISADDLPVNDDGSVDEDAPDVDVVREIEDIEDGDDANRTYELDPGKYVFICNIVEDIEGEETSHYAAGMRAELTITEDGAEDSDDGDEESPTSDES